MYKTLEALGPAHEFFPVNGELKALPIVGKVLKSNNTEEDCRRELPEIVRKRVQNGGPKTGFREVILNVYSKLAESLIDNRLHFAVNDGETSWL